MMARRELNRPPHVDRLACIPEGVHGPVSALEVWPPTLEAKTYEAFIAYVEPRMEIVESVSLLRVPARPL